MGGSGRREGGRRRGRWGLGGAGAAGAERKREGGGRGETGAQQEREEQRERGRKERPGGRSSPARIAQDFSFPNLGWMEEEAVRKRKMPQDTQTVLSMARGNSHPDANNPFQYGGKCKCRSKASHQRHPPEMSHLVGTGAVSTC
ncbi:uncharacterized protein LOC135404168 isoform X2 [Pseudopipra pipra]|uniref:uncharacterized protein LOC135404168 isoform X2 n=1 Tax=Pseudopipra pipra TaxID=415032 RepID=UPI00313A2FD2